jgi:flavodoxin
LAILALLLALPTKTWSQETSFGKSIVFVFSPLKGEILETIVNRIVSTTGAETFRIEPTVPYPTDEDAMIAAEEARIKSGQPPELKNPPPDLSGYDTIFIGTSSWFGDRPDIVALFMSQMDCKGAKVAFFATTGPKPKNIIKSLSSLVRNGQALKPGLISKKNEDRSTEAILKKTDTWLSKLK